MRGLARLVEWQIATAIVIAVAAGVFLPGRLRQNVLAGIAAVLVAMLIGFMPLRVMLRHGPDRIVAGWLAAMIVRMFATLIGLVLLLKRYRIDLATCVWTVCGMYLLLLAIETVGMIGLMRREFEKRRASLNGEPGER
jgi:hypothetical protein